NSNQLTALPDTIAELKNLQILKLGNNQLTALPDTIAELKNLQILDLYRNPLESPPMEIAQKGIKAIGEYFKSLKGEKRPLNEVKVILVGDGGAGKTSLVKQLLGEKFNISEPQTHGIKIKPWHISESGIDVKVHLWDFGGQQIMHATHQFFLSKRSLYVLVLDGRKDEKAEYWLKHIESFGGDSQILVVINKIDENPGHDVNRVFLQDKYKAIKGFHRVSCADGRGVDEFSQGLSKELSEVEMMQTTWAKSWFDVKTRLEDMTTNFISFAEYKKICEENNISEKSTQDILVDFLNDLGIILHFKDFELLDTHVLEPRWVTEAVYKIINSEKLAECKGVLKLSFLDELLKRRKNDKYYYPSDKYKYIIDLMKKFELCYQLDTQSVLIPDLLDISQPAFDFDYGTAIRIVVRYDFLPKSIMPRFIVKMHEDIKTGLQWRTGVVLYDDSFNSTAVIKADEEDEKISIYVSDDSKRDYLSVVRHSLKIINTSFKKLKIEELVPCICDICAKAETPRYYDYATLIKFDLKGKSVVTCPESVDDVSIGKLLSGIEGKEETLKSKKEYGETILQVKQEFHQQFSQVQETNITIDLKFELPQLQSSFDQFKHEAAKLDSNLAKELDNIESDLLEITPNSEQGSINKALNQLSGFLNKLDDKDSKFNKVISGADKALDYGQKLGKTYNKFAQWLALPQVPDLFLGKD
ncbi:MAG: GTP-binding protein, partial [candidate division Zixibacteria bacterium]|nr:GTP-binding protein [candidate division Zixibacteria bacterium]